MSTRKQREARKSALRIAAANRRKDEILGVYEDRNPYTHQPDDRPKQPLTSQSWITVPPKPKVTKPRSAKLQGWERTIGSFDPHNTGREYLASPPSYDGGRSTPDGATIHPDQAVNGRNHR